MNSATVLQRELKVTARDWTTHRGRCLMALYALVWSGLLYILSSALGGVLAKDTQMFLSTSSLAFLLCGFLGIGQTCDCISGEKRAGTLGLLFLTPLTAWDVVIGKLVARTFRSLCELVSCFPVLAACFLFGGVSNTEFWKVTTNLVLTLLFSASLGLLVSVFVRRARVAASLSGTIVALSIFVFPALSELLRRNGFSPDLCFALQFLSPSYGHIISFEFLAGARLNFFGWSCAKMLILSFLFLWMASFVLRRNWQDEPRARLFAALRAWFERIRQTSPRLRLEARMKRLDVNPFFWLSMREPFVSAKVWLVILAVLGFLSGVLWVYGNQNPGLVIAWSIAGAMLMVGNLLLSILAAACLRLAEDKESGALELVLATPISPRNIIAGHWQALRKQFGVPGLFIAIFAAVRVSTLDDANARGALQAVLILGGMAIPAFVWVGMWMALRVREARAASAAAFVRVVLLPAGIWVVLIPFCAGLQWERKLAIGFYLFIVNSLVLCFFARRLLLRDLRTAAINRFHEPARGWRPTLL